MKSKHSRRIYLDHASTTPLDADAFSAMKPYLTRIFANPSALYREGVDASKDLSGFRKSIASVLHALPDEIVMTGSGTESDNLAILGVLAEAFSYEKHPHFVTSSIEHPAVLEAFGEAKKRGARITIIDPDERGIVSAEALRKALTPRTVLVSLMYANNEIGSIQPIREVAKAIRHFRKHSERSTKNPFLPYFHVDASQAANYCPLNVLELGIDLMTLDGSKIYGPKGVGVLFVKRGTRIAPLVFGGGQERGLRSGTESLAQIAGFAAALQKADALREKEAKRIEKLRDLLWAGVQKHCPEAVLNGDRAFLLPNTLNFCVPGLDAEYAVILADKEGILCSAASSCRTLSENARSYVIEAIGKPECAESSLRFTLGRETCVEDIRFVLACLPKILSSARIS